MNIINFDQNFESPSFINTLIYAFQQAKFFPLTQFSRQRSEIYFTGVLTLKKSKQYLQASFRVNLNKAKTIKLQLSLNPQTCGFSNWLSQFFQKKFRQICHFVHITNHLRLSERQGVLKISQETGKISFKRFIHSVSMLSSPLKQATVITSHINKTINIFSQTIEKIIFYYRIPGFDLNQLQNMLQEQNTIQLKSVTQKILALKTYFDKDHQPTSSNNEQVVRNSQQLLRGVSLIDTLISSKMNKDYFSKIQSEYRIDQKMMDRNMQKFQQFKFDSILTAIQIKQKTMQQTIIQGGYSYITYGLYNFVPLFSVHSQVANLLPSQQKQKDKSNNLQSKKQRTGCCLVKKASLSREHMEESLKNQCEFLTYMKAKVCPYFAKYYCNKAIAPFADGQIYLQYYPTSLEQTRLRQQGKLKILEDVCMGLFFLGREQILHRDLKEGNIMIDRNKKGRIIDFGSVIAFNKSQKFKLQDNQLRSTEGYYFGYRKLRQNYPAISSMYTKDEYYKHPNFDIYSLGRIIYNQFSLQMIVEEGEFLRYCLHYLSMRCLQVNPADRWPISKILFFVRQLLIYLDQQRRFWKFGFEQKCKSHLIGSTFSSSEFSAQQQASDIYNLKEN